MIFYLESIIHHFLWLCGLVFRNKVKTLMVLLMFSTYVYKAYRYFYQKPINLAVINRSMDAFFISLNDDATIKLHVKDKNVNFDFEGIIRPQFTEDIDSCERKLANLSRTYVYNTLASAASVKVDIIKTVEEVQYGDLTVDGVSLSDLLIKQKLAYRASEKAKDPIKTWCNLFYSRASE